MNRIAITVLILMLLAGCKDYKPVAKRTPLARVGNVTLYYDQVTEPVGPGTSESDSIAIISNYINKWTRKEIMTQKAEDNLTPEFIDEMTKQLEETRSNLLIYQYQRQMMEQKLDTVISEEEIEDYYAKNEQSLKLNTNIVKALFVKIPKDSPDIDKARIWCRSSLQSDITQLESYCYEFAEKYDDFDELWITMNQLSGELPEDIQNQDEFLKRTSFYETTDSASVYFISVRDYRLKLSIAPYDYIRDEIKGIILNNRRFEYLKTLEEGIYNEALKDNTIKIF